MRIEVLDSNFHLYKKIIKPNALPVISPNPNQNFVSVFMLVLCIERYVIHIEMYASNKINSATLS